MATQTLSSSCELVSWEQGEVMGTRDSPRPLTIETQRGKESTQGHTAKICPEQTEGEAGVSGSQPM